MVPEPDIEEVEFFVDLASNEVERWIESVSQIPLDDGDNLLQSLAMGQHFKWFFKNLYPEEGTRIKQLQDLTTVTPELFLTFCRDELNFLPSYLFLENDFDNCSSSSDWLCQCRVLICFDRFATEFESRRGYLNGVKFDHEALQPLIELYKNTDSHSADSESKSTQILNSHPSAKECQSNSISSASPSLQLGLPLTPVPPDTDSHSHSSDSGVQSAAHTPQHSITAAGSSLIARLTGKMDAVATEKVHKYLAELALETDDLSDSSEYENEAEDDGFSGPHSQSSTSPFPLGLTAADQILSMKHKTQLSPASVGDGDRVNGHVANTTKRVAGIPTRSVLKATSDVPHNPLRFVNSTKTATFMAANAKKQIQQTEEMKALRDQMLQMRTDNGLGAEEEEDDWQEGLNNWLSKRKASTASLQAAQKQALDASNAMSKQKKDDQLGSKQGAVLIESLHSKQRKTITFHLAPDSDNDERNIQSSRNTKNQSHTKNGQKVIEDNLQPTSINQTQKKTTGTKSVQSMNHPKSGQNGAGNGLETVQSTTLMSSTVTTTKSDTKHQVHFHQSALEDSGHFGPDSDELSERSHSRRSSGGSSDQVATPTIQTTPTHQNGTQNTNNKQEVNHQHNNQVSSKMTTTTTAYSKHPLTELPAVHKLIEGRRGRSPMRPQQTLSEETADSGLETNRDSLMSPSTLLDINTDKGSPLHVQMISPQPEINEEPPNEAPPPPPIDGNHQIHAHSTMKHHHHHNAHLSVKTSNNEQKWTYQQRMEKQQLHDCETLCITIHEKPSAEKGFGFSVKGGKNHHEPVTIESVIIGTAADKASVQIRDEVLAINGEPVTEYYLAKVNHIIHESLRLGEIELTLKRLTAGEQANRSEQLPAPKDKSLSPSANSFSPMSNSSSGQSGISFDQKRSMFVQQQNAQTKTLHKGNSKNSKWQSAPMHNPAAGRPPSLHANAANEQPSPPDPLINRSPGRIIDFVPDAERVNQLEANQRVNHQAAVTSTRVYNSNSNSNSNTINSNYNHVPVNGNSHPAVKGNQPGFDYKVTAWTPEREVGKLDDFVPESERNSVNGSSKTPSECGSRSHRTSTRDNSPIAYNRRVAIEGHHKDEHTVLIRNYELGSHNEQAITSSISPQFQSSLHSFESRSDRPTRDECDYPSVMRLINTQQRHATNNHGLDSEAPTDRNKILSRPSEVFRRSVGSARDRIDHIRKRHLSLGGSQHQKNVSARAPISDEHVKTTSTSALHSHHLDNQYVPFRPAPAPSYHTGSLDRCHLALKKYEQSEKTINFTSEFDSTTIMNGSPAAPKRVHFSKNELEKGKIQSESNLETSGCPNEGGNNNDESDCDGTQCPNPFYYQFNVYPRYSKQNPPQKARRQHSVLVVPAREQFSQSKEEMQQRHQLIKQQSHARPNTARDTTGTNGTSHGAQGKTHKSVVFSKELLPGLDHPAPSKAAPGHQSAHGISTELRLLNLAAKNEPQKSDTNEHWMVTQSDRLTDQVHQQQTLSGTGPMNAHPHPQTNNRARSKSPRMGTRAPPPSYMDIASGHSTLSTSTVHSSNSLNLTHNAQQHNHNVDQNIDEADEEPILAVSGRHKCGHCHRELGRGAAMIIESLSLFYHLSCFRCYVCGESLGNGVHGADVRVRAGKLHCSACYSNDEAGWKYSEV